MTEGKKYDAGKPRWDLMPWEQLEDVAKVLTLGAEKYGDENWKKVEPRRYIAAMFRHAWRGAELDEESGLPHYAHAIACMLFLMWFGRNKFINIEPSYIIVRPEDAAAANDLLGNHTRRESEKPDYVPVDTSSPRV